MTQGGSRRTIAALALVAVLCGLPGLGLVTRALQSGEIFSPASGHAQVIAQGASALPSAAVWRTVFYSIEPGSETELPAAGPGFILVDTGGVLVDDGAELALLAPAEASFRQDAATRLTPIGDRPAGLFAIDLAPPESAGDAGGGIPVYASAPFAPPAGARDVDLVRDLLEPGESTTVIGNQAPVLVLVTLGAVRAQATDGSSATLQVGQAATFGGDIVITGEGQAPATFIAAVIGREVPLASGTPGAGPAAETSGTVQVTVYACPPLVGSGEASPGRCLRDPEAVSLRLSKVEGSAFRDVGPSRERQGLPTWAGLEAGDYALQASGFKQGFNRFLTLGLRGVTEEGSRGLPAEESSGYAVPISADAAEYNLEVYVFSSETEATPAPAETPSAAPAATGIPSVIQVETAVPGATAVPTATPRPEPITTATAAARPTERSIVTSTAVARPRRGSIDVRVFGCQDSVELFNPANCAQAVGGFDVQLVDDEGNIVGLESATVESGGSVTWSDLPLGTYLFQQPLLLPGATTYFVPDRPLADNATGYLVTIDADEPVASIDVYSLPPSPVPTPVPAAPEVVDSDGDGILDGDEIAVYGTDPGNFDSDFDGLGDGAEIAAGTDPLLAEGPPPVEPAGDSDGDRLADGDEATYGTDPNNPDTDGDGWFDLDEINLGTNPLDGTSFPVG